jgi:3-oxoacyl-[acyl-carrier-protein] synthase III
MTRAFIVATDYVLPERVVTNEEIAARHPEWRLAELALRTGVIERRWAAPTETSLDLGAAACEKLFDRIGFDRSRIDAILFCTQTPDYVMPPNACLLQSMLRLTTKMLAVDYSLACSGFLYGLIQAHGLIASGSARNVLLVTAETYSKLVSEDDRGPATLFGDGAAATIVAAGADGLGGFVAGTDGRGGMSFCVPAGGARTSRATAPPVREADRFGNVRSAFDIHMNGAAVLAFVKSEIPPLALEVLDRSNLTMDDVDLVLMHQASKMGTDFVYEALKVPEAKRFINLARVGNVVSASLPIVMRDAEQAGKLKPGMTVLLLAFGVGWSWAGGIARWS